MTKIPQKLIIFDCDGVLVDSEIILTTEFTKRLTEAGYPLTVEDSIKRFTGKSAKTIYQEINDDQIIYFSPSMVESIQTEIHAALHQEVMPIPGMSSLLKKLKENHPICVASSGTLEKIQKSLNKANLREHFGENHLFSAQSVAHGKPAPDLFLHAAKEMGYAPHESIVIEDSPAGIEAALAASMDVIGFLGGSHANFDWYQQQILTYPIPIAHNCDELETLLKNWIKS